MSRKRHYLEVDVVEEATRRIEHVAATFDSLVIMFSGGKDSLVLLELCHRILGDVEVVFRDEELIPADVIEFVDLYRRKDWLNMRWYCFPLESQEFVLGETRDYTQWDPNRRHVRPMPAWALRDDSGSHSQYTMDAEVARHFPGKVAFLTGIRASESLIRYRASVNKLNENYITRPFTGGKAAPPKNVMMAKPLFDWEENDIFKWLGEHNILPCDTYVKQMWAGHSLRVSTPLHQESAKKFDKLKLFDPVLYAQIIDIFPDMLLQERYYREFNQAEKEPSTWDELRTWIGQRIRDRGQRSLAMKRFVAVRGRMETDPTRYPLRYVWQQFKSGAYKREILPTAPRS